MKSAIEVLEALTKEKEAFYEMAQDKLSGVGEPVKTAIMVASTEAFQAGFIAAIKITNETQTTPAYPSLAT